ncbi:glycosyltransferase family 4 protein [Legionella jamestowniensis]|uniref:Glycosyltransferase, group 1 family n=1 Tax=Legionella jamestowniensis TaxID=455 RepID=A0A0W0UG37_9GAMM|nr:glycosyltransferase family 4 protein [Legionella jamestowniensis]KTD06815.1 glycosyltransferase, group 1 family [Legionella jamestowniensis]SFL82807.1 Glycosyltransferase involved in cell wall bisynthesis [Legionella jamestowniensis DSM 19215]
MKVLYFHQHFSTPKGTTGIRSYEMSKQLIKRGHEVTIVCGSYGEAKTGLSEPFVNGCRRGTVDGIEIIEFDLAYSNHDRFLVRAKTFIKFAVKSLRLVFTEKYDLIFATSTPLTVAIPGIFARWLLKKPFVFEVRDLWPELPKAMRVIRNPIILSAMSLLEWLSYHSAHRLIGLSPGIVNGILQRGVVENKVKLLPNGCDLQIFSVPNIPWRPNGINEKDFFAIFAGTHGIANGLNSVLDAAAELKRRGRSDIKLLLIGQGKLKSELQKRVLKENLDNVIFHDPVDKKKLAGLMETAHLGLQILADVPAFYYGTSPNKFFDYIASGLPVLNNYPGWLADLITQKDCGFVIPPNMPIAFADVLEYASENRHALCEKGERARLLAKTDFDRTMLADNFVDWLEGACVG